MRKFIQKILREPVKRWADKYSSRPDKEKIHKALFDLNKKIKDEPGTRGPMLNFAVNIDRFIILSDQHKGARNGADDFAIAERNYLAALDYYYNNNFNYISLGDCEELWENRLVSVKKHNTATFEKEKLFLQKKRFIKVFGNHDLDWDNNPLAPFELQKIYGEKIKVYEGVILKTMVQETPLEIFLTHGHQGDAVSDGNWFSKWFVANVWAPMQAYLAISPNTPAYEDHLKTDHNRFMYEWVSQQENMLLITGHTHQPVFESLTLLERLYRKLSLAREQKDEATIKELQAEIVRRKLEGQTIPDFTAYKPNYFNSGCCCFDDGDITGIEIDNGTMSLIKWEYNKNNEPCRILLEQIALTELMTKKVNIISPAVKV
ncbi:MAG: metallophosphoesterase [Segetibacter sp.]|nr:metallophosphoesterase [Segetibacter sp.]